MTLISKGFFRGKDRSCLKTKLLLGFWQKLSSLKGRRGRLRERRAEKEEHIGCFILERGRCQEVSGSGDEWTLRELPQEDSQSSGL